MKLLPAFYTRLIIKELVFGQSRDDLTLVNKEVSLKLTISSSNVLKLQLSVFALIYFYR